MVIDGLALIGLAALYLFYDWTIERAGRAETRLTHRADPNCCELHGCILHFGRFRETGV